MLDEVMTWMSGSLKIISLCRSMVLSYRYPSVNCCVYCRNKEQKLGDEHIIQLSMNGWLILPDASCYCCADITKRYEQAVARDIFGNFRMIHKVRTRHKKQRPTHLSIGTLLPDGTKGTKQVLISEFPTMLFVYKFGEARILSFLESQNKVFKWEPVSIFNNQMLDDFIQKHHWDRHVSFVTKPLELARTLAKIGYSYAVAELGLNSFHVLPNTIDTILNRTDDVFYSVGGDWEIPAPNASAEHLLELKFLIEKNGEVFIIVDIRLFPAFETPQYHVVVGKFDLRNPQHAMAYDTKIANAKDFEYKKFKLKT
jgi:hypothetical protein